MRSKIGTGIVGLAALGLVLHFVHEQRAARAELDRMRAQLESKSIAVSPLSGSADGGAAVAELARRAARQEVRRTIAEQRGGSGGDAAGEAGGSPEGTAAAPSVEESRERVLTAFADEPVDRSWGPTSTGELD